MTLNEAAAILAAQEAEWSRIRANAAHRWGTDSRQEREALEAATDVAVEREAVEDWIEGIDYVD